MFMTRSYIPNSDSDFLTWATTFSTYLTAHAADLPIDAAEVTAVSSDVSTLRTNLNNHDAAKDAAHSARLNKDESRSTAEDAIRGVVRQLKASPLVTDIQLEAMGIPAADTIRSMGAAPEMYRPVGSVDTSQRLLHTIRYWDEAGSGKARPEYAVGCEVWMKITAPGEPVPINPDEFNCLGLNSASPYVQNHDGADGGKMAHYILRWIARGGEKGPWSEVLSATIVG
jgi:hypothetical protein